MNIRDIYKKLIDTITANQKFKHLNMVRVGFFKEIEGEAYCQSFEFYLAKAIRWDGNFYQLIQIQVDRINKNFDGKCDEIWVTFFCEQDNRVPIKKYIFK